MVYNLIIFYQTEAVGREETNKGRRPQIIRLQIYEIFVMNIDLFNSILAENMKIKM